LLFRMGKRTFGIPKAENTWISVQASLSTHDGMQIKVS